jgi:hypothetical protein
LCHLKATAAKKRKDKDKTEAKYDKTNKINKSEALQL